MIVSWQWLKEYVALDVSPAELTDRLMMAGLNHESTTAVDGDLAIDLEVTSNRADCLGHIGIAREIAVLFGRELTIPAAAPKHGSTPVAALAAVTLQCPALAPRYTARVIRGVKVKPSPDWLVRRLATVGIAAVNNVVDISNYVLMECGQPLHAFDLSRLSGRRIVVREAAPGEKFLAINHKEYELTAGMCVIADARRSVAIGGVMGGADTEVSPATSELLIESAAFDPIAIRNTARRLALHSPSSYRFERSPDPEAVDWASRRCCELILELAGGELAAGVLDVGSPPAARAPITLRLSEIERILGIHIETSQVRRILSALGNREIESDAALIEVTPPSWRRDLEREIDLIEEVARIHGYDMIPEDTRVPMVPSHRSDEDRVLVRARHVLTAAGCDEAMTASVVDEATSEAYSPWTDAPPLATRMPLLRGATQLRRSLVPSLLAARRTNESLSNARIELFEIAKVYLPRSGGLPSEQKMLAVSSGRDYPGVKGIIEALLAAVNPARSLEVVDNADPLFESGRGAELRLCGEKFGFLGEVSADVRRRFQLRGPTTVAEIKLSALVAAAELVPQYVAASPYPAVERDLNFEVDMGVHWISLAETVVGVFGPRSPGLLERLECVDTKPYPELKWLSPGRKSVVLRLVLRSKESTLTSEAVDEAVAAVITECLEQHGARLRA